jgi:AcrR family transcriptional regulator
MAVSETIPRPEAVPSRRERRKQEIHDRLLEAAQHLFDQKGFAATTVDEICERADVSQKTFFNYFPTKHHVVRELAEAFLEDVAALIEEARKQPGPTADRLTHLFHRVAEESLRAGPRHKELLVEVVRVAQVDGSGPEQSRRLHAAFRALLEDGAALSELTIDHDVAFLTEMVLAAFISILLNWQSVEGYPLGEHLDEAARFLGRAISRTDRLARKERSR